MKPLSADFFERATVDVARELIGKLLVHEHPSGRRLVGRIVETEAYTQDDPACHGFGLLDRDTGNVRAQGRGFDLYGRPGKAYVYLIYGSYWLLNVVTEREGVGGGVLLRAVEPVEGQSLMWDFRAAARRERDLTSGPGKLTLAFDVDERFHNRMLTEPPLYFADPFADPSADPEAEPPGELPVATSSRIGITKGVEHPWRFFVPGSPFVSPGRPSDEVMAAKRRRKRRF